jgi:hypothetical protein
MDRTDVIVYICRHPFIIQAGPGGGNHERTYGSRPGDSSIVVNGLPTDDHSSSNGFPVDHPEASVNRWTNISLGILYTLVNIGNLIGETWAYYILFGIVEILMTLLIVRSAWKWI